MLTTNITNDPADKNNGSNDKRQNLIHMPVPTPEGFDMIDSISIIYFEAIGSSTAIILELSDREKERTGKNTRRIISSKSLGYFEALMASQPFIRIHNSFIANMNKARRFVKGDNAYLLMVADITLAVSRNKKEGLLNFLFPGR